MCPFYANNCLNENGGSAVCKHILAAKLAKALNNSGMLKVKIIQDVDFGTKITSNTLKSQNTRTIYHLQLMIFQMYLYNIKKHPFLSNDAQL